MRRLRSVALGLGLCMAGPQPLHAAEPEPEPEPAPVVFEWRAPAQCPDETRLRAMIEHRLGRSLEVAHSRPMTVSATVERVGEGWTLRVVTQTEDGERQRVVSPEGACERVAKAAALIVALTIDPTAVPPADEAPDAPRAEVEVEVEPEPEPAVLAPAPPPSARARPRGTARAFGLVGAGVLPRLDAGVGGAAGVFMTHWRAELVGAYLAAPVLGLESGASVRFDAWYAGLRGCGVLTKSRLEFPICAGADLGRLRATPAGLEAPREARSLWAAIVLAPGLTVRVHPNVALNLGIDAVVPLRRPDFTVGGLGAVHRAFAVAVRGLLGLEVRFP